MSTPNTKEVPAGVDGTIVEEENIRGRVSSKEPEPPFILTPSSAPKLQGINDFRQIWPAAIQWFGELFELLSPDSSYPKDLFSGSFRRISTYGVTSLTELENMFDEFCKSIPSQFRPALEPEISKLKGAFEFTGALLVEKMVTAIRDEVTARLSKCKPLPDTDLTPKEWLAEWQGKKEEVISFINGLLRNNSPFLYNAVEYLRVWLEGQKKLIQARYEEAANGQKAAFEELLEKAKLVEGAEERIAEVIAERDQLRDDFASERKEVGYIRGDNERLRTDNDRLGIELNAKQVLLRGLQNTMLGQSVESIQVIRENGGILVLTDQVEGLQRVVASLVRDIKVLNALYTEATGKDFEGDTDLSRINQGEITIRPKAETEYSAETFSAETVENNQEFSEPQSDADESELRIPDAEEISKSYSEDDSEKSPEEPPTKGIDSTDDQDTDDQDDQSEKPK